MESLYSLAFKQVHRHIWQVSALPKLLVDIINKKCSQKTINTELYHTKVTQNLEKIRETLWSCDYPFRLKVKILSAVAGMNHDISAYIEEIAGSLDKPVKRNIRYCMENIIWTSNNTIDMTETILYIMQKSSLEVTFDTKFLGHHCISVEDVENAMENNTILHLESKRLKRAAKSKYRQVTVNNTAKIQKYLQSVMDIEYYWSNIMRSYDRYFQGSMLQYVTKNTHQAHALDYFLDLFLEEYAEQTSSDTSSNESDNDDQTDSSIHFQNVLIELAEWALEEQCCCPEKIILFKDNLSAENWSILVRKFFRQIILILLNSWTHRDCCIEIYNNYLDQMNVDMLRTLFTEFALMCKENEFEYFDIVSVVQLMWEITPVALKYDHDLTFVLIPKIIMMQMDFESLVHFIKPYNIYHQKNTVGLIVFELYATSREHLVATCLKTIRQVGLQITDPRDLLTKELLKKFLSIDARSETKSYDQIKTLAQLLCDTEEQVSALKSDLFNDDSFCVELLSGISHKKDFKKLLSWGLDDKQLQLFKERLLKKELIPDIYDRRLVENTTIEDADCIFNWLEFSPHEVQLVKSRVRENMTVVRMVLLNMIETDHTLLETNKEWLLGSNEAEIMKMILYSKETVIAIYKMCEKKEDLRDLCSIIPLDEFDDDDSDCLDVIRFVTNWLMPFVSMETFIAYMISLRHLIKADVFDAVYAIKAVCEKKTETKCIT